MPVRLIRTSERRDFKRCRLRWEYRHLRHLRPQTESRKLNLGQGVHLALAAFYNHPSWQPATPQRAPSQDAISAAVLAYDAWIDAQEEPNADDVELGQGVLIHYLFDFAPESDYFDIVAVEMRFQVPVARGLWLRGTIDGLVRSHQDGRLWVLEHKTAARIETDYLDLDDQATAYCWGINELLAGRGYVELGEQVVADRLTGELSPRLRRLYPGVAFDTSVAGVLYNHLRKARPKEPVITKSGQVSRADVDTTETLYLDAIRRAAGNVEDYQEELDRIRRKEWFKRTKVYRSADELQKVRGILIAEDREMRRAEKDARLRYRSSSMDCNWDCSFRELCIGEFKGVDMQPLVDAEFIQEEAHAV